MRARSATATALGAALLLASLPGCGASSSTPEGDAAAPRSVAPPPVLRRVSARDADAFALLRTRPEGLPAAVRQALRTPIVGENWALAQRIDTAAPGRYWLVPGIGHLCIVSQ